LKKYNYDDRPTNSFCRSVCLPGIRLAKTRKILTTLNYEY